MSRQPTRATIAAVVVVLCISTSSAVAGITYISHSRSISTTTIYDEFGERDAKQSSTTAGGTWDQMLTSHFVEAPTSSATSIIRHASSLGPNSIQMKIEATINGSDGIDDGETNTNLYALGSTQLEVLFHLSRTMPYELSLTGRHGPPVPFEDRDIHRYYDPAYPSQAFLQTQWSYGTPKASSRIELLGPDVDIDVVAANEGGVFDPGIIRGVLGPGTYTFRYTFEGWAENQYIDMRLTPSLTVIPLPNGAWAGLCTIGLLLGIKAIRARSFAA